MILRYPKINFLAVMLVSFFLGTSLPCTSSAASAALDEWQRKVAATRTLAENDAPRAYQEAQQLQAVMPGDASGADKAKIVNLLARIELYLGDIGKSSQHSAEAQKFAKQNNDHVGQIEADLVIAASAINQGRLEDMIEATKDAMDLLVGLEREDLRAEVMFHVAMMYNRFGHFDESVTIAMQSLEIAKNSGNPLALAYAEQGIAASFDQSELHVQAGEHFQRMLEAARQAHSTLLEAGAVLGLSGIAGKRGSASESERLCKEAIALFRRAGGPFFVSHAVHLLADQYRKNKQPAKALPLIDENVALYEQHENPIGLWWTLNMRSTLLQDLGRLDAARSDAERANELAKKIGFTVYLAGSARRLADVDAARGEFKQAYRRSTEASELNAKLERENSSKRILDLAQRFQQESKQRQIDELTQRNRIQAAEQRWLWTMLGGSILILIGASYFLNRLRHSNRELGLLNTQLNTEISERKQVEEQLALLGMAINRAHEAIYLSDDQFRLFYVNDEACRALGYSREELLNMTIPDVDPDISLETAEQIKQLILAAGHINIETYHKRKNGEIFPVELTGTVIEHEGRAMHLSLVRDITDRKKAEYLLHLREQEFRAMVEHSPDIIARFDTDCRRIYANPRLRAQFNLPVEAILGKTPLELSAMPEAQAYMLKIRDVLTSGQESRMEFPYRDPQGGMYWGDMRLVPEFGTDGKVASVLAITRDITERKQAEDELATYREHLEELVQDRTAALQASEARLRALAESSPGMMGSFYLKPDGCMCMPYVSPNIFELFGLRPQDVAEDASPLLNLSHPDDAQRVRDSISESARTMTPWRCEYRIMHPVNGERWMEGHSNPLPHPEGGVIWYGYVLDITERKRIEAALKESKARYQDNFNLLQSVLESSSSVSVYALDREYRLLAFNRKFSEAAKRLWGADIAIGMNILDAIDTETHRQFFRQGAEQVLSGRSYALDSKEAVVKDGVTVYEYHENYGSPIRNDDGEIIGLTIFVITVTERKQLEADLRASRNFLDSVIDSVSDPIFVKDRQHRWVLSNEAFCNLIGQPREKLIGKSDYDFLPKEQSDVFWEKDELVFNSGETNVNEETITGTGGQTSYLQTKKTPFVSADGQELLVGVIRDITERKQMEEILRTSEEKLSNLFALSPLGIALTDMNGKYIEFNEAFSKICGYPVDELMTLDYWTLTPKEYEAREAEQLASLSNTGRYGPYEKEYRQKNGSLIPIQLIGVLVKGRDGKDYIWSIVEDITVRKHMEEELQHREQMFRALAENAPDNIVRFDTEGRFVYVNPVFERTLGRQASAMIGTRVRDNYSDGSFDAYAQTLENVLASGRDGEIEQVLPDGAGGTRIHHVRMVAERNEAGDLVGVLAIGRDITELKRYEAAREAALTEAVRLADLRSEFIAHMSHELRTPLNGILGYAQMLGRDGKLDDKQHASMDVIRQSGEHLLALVDDILDLARIESGKLELDIGDIPLARVLNVVVGIVGVKAKQKQLEFVCEFAPDLPQGIRGDEKRLRQVLLNLLSNAIKFTDSGRITLSVNRVTPSRLAFAVADTGIGIAPSDWETIFQSFEQVSDTQHRLGGTGLGLSISRQLVRLMGGDIVFESRPGAGSTFRFELELPDASIESDVLHMPAAGTQHIEPDGENELAEPQIAPPQEELQALHRLALLGNMRDIAEFAERIIGIDPRYRPFAERLKRMANGYQSKAILAFVEEHLI